MKKSLFKKLFIVFILGMITGLVLNGQSVASNSTKTITLDKTIQVNANHPYIENFSKEDEEYIAMLYAMNLTNMANTPEYRNPARIIKNSKGNNSLIFTIEEKGELRYDTLRNSLHPDDYDIRSGGGFLGIRKLIAKWTSKSLLNKMDLQGDLPEGAMTWISAKRWGLEFGVLVPNTKSDVKVEIATLDGKVIATVVDQSLLKGWNNYEWNRKRYKKGTYQLRIVMDDELLTQNFKM